MYSDEYFQQQADLRWLSNEVQRKIKEVQSDPSMDYSDQRSHDERCVIALSVHGLAN